jgi:hypothetical protein
MKKTVLCVANRHGVSYKTLATGKEWAMCRLYYLDPLEIVSGEKFNQVGFGFQAQEIDLDPACISQFSDLKFPVELNLIFAPKDSDISKNWVVGISK